MADSGVMQFLFNGQPPPSVTSSSTSESGMPAWLQDLVKGLATKADALASAPYQAPTAPRVAGLTSLQNQAAQQTQDLQGKYTPAVTGALSTLGDISSGTGVNNVTDAIARLGQRNLSEKLLPAIDSTFIGAGQFGGSRQEDFTGRAVRDENESVLNAQAQALLQDQGQRIGAASAIPGIATAGQTMGLRDAAALDVAGQEQQTNQQANLDTAYQQFLEERGWAQNQLGNVSNIVRGLPVDRTLSSTNTGPASVMQPSGLATLAGGALTAASLQNLFKAPAAGGRDGGRVMGYAKGGPVIRGVKKFAMTFDPMDVTDYLSRPFKVRNPDGKVISSHSDELIAREKARRLNEPPVEEEPVEKRYGGRVRGALRYAEGGAITDQDAERWYKRGPTIEEVRRRSREELDDPEYWYKRDPNAPVSRGVTTDRDRIQWNGPGMPGPGNRAVIQRNYRRGGLVYLR